VSSRRESRERACGHEETIYRRATCGSFIEHTNDKNEFAPFWYVVNDPAAKKS
jgi:hypothetical protein